jgi:hypothetical protein
MDRKKSSARPMIRQAWLPLCVMVASSGCGGEANLGTGNVDASPEASSEGSPTGDAASVGCRSNADCPDSGNYENSYSCFGPYQDLGCICSPVATCAKDSDCDGGTVCREDPSVAPACLRGAVDSGLVCTLACKNDGECALLDRCEDDGHCVARTCAQCPSYFSCASGSCVIPTCSHDSDCPGGYCVIGTCSGVLGTCKHNCS